MDQRRSIVKNRK